MSKVKEATKVAQVESTVKNEGKVISTPEVKLPQVSKKILEKQAKIESFDNAKATNWTRLIDTANRVVIEGMGMNKMIRTFIEQGKNLTEGQKSVLTFDNVKDYIAKSKYKDLSLFSVHQMKLICNTVIKDNDKATQIAARVAKQGGTIVQK